jgi:hypothetical protein
VEASAIKLLSNKLLIGVDGEPPPPMGPHVKVPLKDLRWKAQGSEVRIPFVVEMMNTGLYL